jgi:hypothetical protein
MWEWAAGCRQRAAKAIGRCVIGVLFVLFGVSLTCFGLDRSAFTFTNYDLKVNVTPATHGLSATGTMTLRNDSDAPQKSLALQISSTLAWQSVLVTGKPVTYVTQPYETDIDHTGAVSEAIVTLPFDVAPHNAINVEVSYSGTITADATRLTRIGSPQDIALRNDWDRITPDFTAVRGVGYVCWYPVAMEAASLSDGNAYFDTLGAWKEREQNATMNVTVEAVGSQNIAANGRLVGTGAHEAITAGEQATREAQFSFAPLGLYPPSFALATFATLSRAAIDISYIPDHRAAAEEFALAAEKVLPFISNWFGAPHAKVQVIELTDPNAVPFDSGTVVFTPLRTADTAQLEVSIAHQLAHACEPAGIKRPWIAEGLAQFAQALTQELEGGRDAAIGWTNNFLPALQAAEKQATTPTAQAGQNGQGSAPTAPPPSAAVGQSLIRSTDPTYYSIKAMYVWWMLRDMVGDDALQRAIHSYRAADDKQPAYMQQLIQTQAKRDLEWFFDDWVYRDRGLPDFHVPTAFARALVPGNYSITVTVENLGDAGAEVPFTVRGEEGEAAGRLVVKAKSSAVQRVQLGARPVSVTVNDGSVPESNTSNDTYVFPAPKSE